MIAIINLLVACGCREGAADAAADSDSIHTSEFEVDSDSSATPDSESVEIDISTSDQISEDDVADTVSVDGESDVDTTYGIDCESPKEGCPCEWGISQPCCLRSSEGLDCSRRLVDGEFVASWSLFHDCGCLDVPECPELYELCPAGRDP